MDTPTPQGCVQDAEEALGKARAMRDATLAEHIEWVEREWYAERYLDQIRAWVASGGTGPRPAKPKGLDCS